MKPSHRNVRNGLAYLIRKRAKKNIADEKIKRGMKIEPSQQIKFPLDGIILTANDINQVFYVHRAVKFIHAHICLNPVAI